MKKQQFWHYGVHMSCCGDMNFKPKYIFFIKSAICSILWPLRCINHFFIGHMWAGCNVRAFPCLSLLSIPACRWLFNAAGLWIWLWMTHVEFYVTVQRMWLHAHSSVLTERAAVTEVNLEMESANINDQMAASTTQKCNRAPLKLKLYLKGRFILSRTRACPSTPLSTEHTSSSEAFLPCRLSLEM